MPQENARHMVAILDSVDEFLDALQFALEAEGYGTVRASLADIQSGALDLVALVEETRPDVVVYDLPRPYERNWNLLRLLKDTESLRRRTWLVTTPDKEALEAAVGASGVVEIVMGRPHGVEDVLGAVRTVLTELDAVTGDRRRSND